MNLLHLISLVFSIVSGYFLSRINFGLTPKNIVLLSKTKYGWNSDILNNLTEQGVFNKIGFYYLIIAIIVEISSSFIYIEKTITSLSISLVFIMVILIISIISSKKMISEKSQEALNLLKKE